TTPKTCRPQAGPPGASSLIGLIRSPNDMPYLYFLNCHPKKTTTVSSRRFENLKSTIKVTSACV
ncbi:MAG: hypothetical protein ACPHOK_00190, partial [Akkermansiaceae bacterium]